MSNLLSYRLNFIALGMYLLSFVLIYGLSAWRAYYTYNEPFLRHDEVESYSQFFLASTQPLIAIVCFVVIFVLSAYSPPRKWMGVNIIMVSVLSIFLYLFSDFHLPNPNDRTIYFHEELRVYLHSIDVNFSIVSAGIICSALALFLRVLGLIIVSACGCPPSGPLG